MKYIGLMMGMAMAMTCACHSDPQAQGTSLSMSTGSFSELVINYGSAVVPETVEEEIAVNAKPEMVRVVTRSWFDEATGTDLTDTVCMGVVPLTDDEFKVIEDLMAASDLATYAPPEDCEVLIGTTGMTFTYRLSNGTANVFHSFCELPATIMDVASGVREIANGAIPDCGPEQAAAPTP